MAKSASSLSIIEVRGVVQGVGFRPFIYRLAHECHLKGWVRNTSGAVRIEIEGKKSDILLFIRELNRKAPAAARIEDLSVATGKSVGYKIFEIRPSLPEKGGYQLISPDIATCHDCLREIFDPSNRRYRYPFTNCTNCGPRFTIIYDIPYDRPKTTMKDFHMCPQCLKEYENPLDRRFHAQPNACPECGPHLDLLDQKGKTVPCHDVLKKTSLLLKSGKIVAIKGIGGFLLACDATSKSAVEYLRDRKNRPAKPFAVMIESPVEIKKHCYVSSAEIDLLKSPGSPIVLLKWKKASTIVINVAPSLDNLGIMLPYSPLHHLLMRETGRPLVMTSGNISEEPIAQDNNEALKKLGNIADYFLVHNRDIYARYDDSVMTVANDEPQFVRRARGFAPHPIHLGNKVPAVLACGAEEKNTFCLTRDKYAFISQHIGDMENLETLEHFSNTVELYKKLFRIKPEIIACDMHPEYLPSKYAIEQSLKEKLPLVKVQHHHAHIVSCLAEYHVTRPVIGVALDGTGFGADGHIWGGEFLIANTESFKRAAHLEYLPLPGGAQAIRKPYRIALSYLSITMLNPENRLLLKTRSKKVLMHH
jgi:hydrogenase maturation protein HypF